MEAHEISWSHGLVESDFDEQGHWLCTQPSSDRRQVCWQPVWAAIHARPLPPPPVGLALLCMLCSQERPWGSFDSHTGAVVCTPCRDAAAQAR